MLALSAGVAFFLLVGNVGNGLSQDIASGEEGSMTILSLSNARGDKVKCKVGEGLDT